MQPAKKISTALRRAIDGSSLSRYAISKRTKVSEVSLSRFMSRRQGLSLESIDKIAKVLGLRMVKEGDNE